MYTDTYRHAHAYTHVKSKQIRTCMHMLTYMYSRKCIRTYTCTNTTHKVIDAHFPTYHPCYTGHTRRRDYIQGWAGTMPAVMLVNPNVINIPYQHAMLELYSVLLCLRDNRPHDNKNNQEIFE
jgi:hypothetical protein